MKKLFITITALMMVALFTAPSFAGGQVQMTLTSPTIYKQGCEKFGATTYSFQENSVINDGDWWYMDLPENVALCKSYNYVILGNTAGSGAISFLDTTIPAGRTVYENATFNNNHLTTLGPGGPNYANGPISLSGVGAGITLVGNMAFYVTGADTSRRVYVYALTENYATNPSLTVAPDTTFSITLFDGQPHTTTGITATDTYLRVRGTNVTTNSYTALIASAFPAVENTLCANAENYNTQYVYTSYASKNDAFTFSGDSQIAHTGTSDITLEACAKTTTVPNVEISGTQGVCYIKYQTNSTSTRPDAYCDMTYRNRFVIKSDTGSFGTASDTYEMDISMTSPTTGVYFSTGAYVGQFTSSQDACDYSLFGNTSNYGFTGYLDLAGKTAALATDWPSTSVCTGIPEKKRIVLLKGASTGFSIASGVDKLYVQMPTLVFDQDVVTAAQEITLQIELKKKPCGTIFKGSRTIGTFVTTCPAASSMSLYYPWLPGTGAPSGWWGGYTLTNVDNVAGTVTVTLRDSAGNSASFTTDSIAPGQLVVLSQLAASATLTQADANNPYDPALNYSVVAASTMSVRGFAFTGDATQGVGYTADK